MGLQHDRHKNKSYYKNKSCEMMIIMTNSSITDILKKELIQDNTEITKVVVISKKPLPKPASRKYHRETLWEWSLVNR